MGQTLLLRALMGWKRPILLNIAQYVVILLNITENLHRDITVQDGIQLFQSGDIEREQDVSEHSKRTKQSYLHSSSSVSHLKKV